MKDKTKDLPACWGVFALTCFFSLSFPLNADQIQIRPQNTMELKLQSIPESFGKVVYQFNEGSPNQLFVIGIGHRDAITRTNGDTTVKSQIETYRLIEWLAATRGLDLLLPEGFFSKNSANSLSSSMHSSVAQKKVSLSTEILEARLNDDVKYANAEILLSESHGIHIRQVEDFNFYNQVRVKLLSLGKSERNALLTLSILADLDYLQERRTAAMLQKIPDIIDREFASGTIPNKEAVFTIGLAHIPEIIRFLEQKQITIASPAFTNFKDFTAELSLLKQDFGVTIIIPKALEEKQKTLPRLTLK